MEKAWFLPQRASNITYRKQPQTQSPETAMMGFVFSSPPLSEQDNNKHYPLHPSKCNGMAGEGTVSDRDVDLYLSNVDAEVRDSKRRDTKAELDFEERRASRSRAPPSPHDPSNYQTFGYRGESRSNYSASAHSIPPSPSLSTHSIPSQAPSQTLQSNSESSNGVGNSNQSTLSQHRIGSRSPSDNGNDIGFMVNMVPRQPVSPSTSTGSVIRNQSPSHSSSPHENGNIDLATLNRQFQTLTAAFTELQASNGKELEETKKALSELRQEHHDYKQAFSDLREEYKDYKTTTHWRLQKIEADLNKAFLEIKQIRIDMQESLNRQAIDIRKNAEEIALHAKEEWQDAAAASKGDSVIRSLEQKMMELKLEVNALRKGGKRKSQVAEDVKRDA